MKITNLKTKLTEDYYYLQDLNTKFYFSIVYRHTFHFRKATIFHSFYEANIYKEKYHLDSYNIFIL